MPSKTTFDLSAKLDDFRERDRLRTGILADLEKLHAIHPLSAVQLVMELGEIAGAFPSNGSVQRPKAGASSARRGSQSQKSPRKERIKAVIQVFMDNGNAWLTRREIEDLAGVTDHTTHTVLYKVPYAGTLRSKPSPDGGNAKVYQLADPESAREKYLKEGDDR